MNSTHISPREGKFRVKQTADSARNTAKENGKARDNRHNWENPSAKTHGDHKPRQEREETRRAKHDKSDQETGPHHQKHYKQKCETSHSDQTSHTCTSKQKSNCDREDQRKSWGIKAIGRGADQIGGEIIHEREMEQMRREVKSEGMKPEPIRKGMKTIGRGSQQSWDNNYDIKEASRGLHKQCSDRCSKPTYRNNDISVKSDLHSQVCGHIPDSIHYVRESNSDNFSGSQRYKRFPQHDKCERKYTAQSEKPFDRQQYYEWDSQKYKGYEQDNHMSGHSRGRGRARSFYQVLPRPAAPRGDSYQCKGRYDGCPPGFSSLEQNGTCSGPPPGFNKPVSHGYYEDR